MSFHPRPSQRHIFILFLALALTLFPAHLVLSAHAQSSTSDTLAANEAYNRKDWKQSVILYERITAIDPKNGRAWYRLGLSLHQNGENEKALSALQTALQTGAPIFFVEYQMALVSASLERPSEVFDHLEKATSSGFAQPDLMLSDQELQPYHSDPRFRKFAEVAEHNLSPCSYAAENHQFDFWLGEWNVVTTAGEMSAGTSRIEKILNDCVILENWSSANSPYQGKSYNTYNTGLKRWEQFWADNSQGMIHFFGSLKNGTMDYWTEAIPQPDGKLLKRHLQFIPLGADKVRQFSQGSNDDGKTWFVEYDFTYNRVK